MWGGPPFWIADNCAVDVRSVSAARDWYKEKLGFGISSTAKKTIPAGRLRTLASLRLEGWQEFVRLSNWNLARLRANSMSFSTRRN